MHRLHRILVHIPDVVNDSYYVCDEQNRESVKECVRQHAVENTSRFGDGLVFDWRDECSADADYPEQVYFANDNVKWFLDELEAIQKYHHREISSSLSQLNEEAGTTDLSVICEKIQSEELPHFNAYTVRYIAQLLWGEYTFESSFYDLDNYSSRIDSRTIEKVKANPENWALVFFDYHN